MNASFALPFCEPRHFPGLWSRIVAAIRPGGRFAGQFFGDRDTWASLPGRTHHSRDEVLELLEGFEIEMMNEEERDDTPDVAEAQALADVSRGGEEAVTALDLRGTIGGRQGAETGSKGVGCRDT